MLNEQLNSTESRGLLQAVDRMREILHDEKIALPEIVVVGDQSVGKSSVLEALSGIQLPRAQNICTRCPLELRMKTTETEEYAIIRVSGRCNIESRITDFTQIATEVTRFTSMIAGESNNVSQQPIYLTVYKRDILYDLTLIDLPGITRNPLPGQDHDIYEQIIQLIKKYIEPDTAIVLHVIPASTDFTTSESMKIAKEFDPLCQRQLIAASKIDKFDKGIADKLQGRGAGSMELRLGCVAVLNRNQDEIDHDISFDEMRRRERLFFAHHKEAFEHLPDEYKGSEQLIRRLATIQQERIRSTFPDIIKILKERMAEKKDQLKKIPPSMDTENECWTYFQSMITVYREKIHDNVKGEYDQVPPVSDFDASIAIDSTDDSSSSFDSDNWVAESEDGSVIAEENTENHIAYHIYQLQLKFQAELRKRFANFLSHEYHKIVLREINLTAGGSLPNFPSYQIIVGLFRKELQKLPQVCINLAQQIHEYTSGCLVRLFEAAFTNAWALLKDRLKEVISKQLDKVKEVVLERIEETLAMERRLFTLNHYYMDTVNELKQKRIEKNTSVDQDSAHTSKAQYASGSNEEQAAKDIQIALRAYSKVVQKRLTDNIAQICYHHFITQCALKIDEHLSTSIPSSQLVHYMREPQSQTNLRKKLMHSIQAHEEALKLGRQHM